MVGMTRPTLDVAMMGCGILRGYENVCVHESSVEGIGVGDHASLALAGLGPNDHTEDHRVFETLKIVVGDRRFALWAAMDYDEFDRLRSVPCSRLAWVHSLRTGTRHGHNCCNSA